jgi:tetratricopeptide (TPR) repeat protein
MASSDGTGHSSSHSENTDNKISGPMSGISMQIGRVEGDAVVESHSGDHHDFRGARFGQVTIGRQPSALHALPAPPLNFTGRSSELGRLCSQLSPREKPQGSAAVTILRGMGGVGKTALALKFGAYAQHEGWFCSELFIDLRGFTPHLPPRTADEALDVLLRAMGTPPESIPPERDERAALYRSSLQALTDIDEQRRPVLVVADNVSLVAQVRSLIPGPGGHQLLMTSRADMAKITGARYLNLSVFSKQESVDLLASALRSADPADQRAELTDELMLLAYRCGFLPLALDICGAFLVGRPSSTPRKLADKLSSRDKLLALADGEDRTIHAVLDVSLERLNDEQSRIFTLLGATFGFDISTAAVAALAELEEEEAEDILDELASAHLIMRSNDRWTMHDLVRAFASDFSSKRLADEDRNTALDRLLYFYADLAAAAAAQLGYLRGAQNRDSFTGRDTALQWLDSELANLLSMASIAHISGPNLTAVELSLTLAGYLGRRRHFHYLLALSKNAQKSSQKIGDKRREANAWANIGLALEGLGRSNEAVEAIRISHDVRRAQDDPIADAARWLHLGNINSKNGEFEKAIDAQTKALNLLRDAGDARNEAGAWTNLGLTLQRMQRLEESIDAHSRAIRLFRGEGETYGEAIALYNLGLVFHEVGRFNDAERSYTESALLYRQGGDKHSQAEVMNSLGLTLTGLGRLPDAAKAHCDARVLFLEIGDTECANGASHHIGESEGD